jgi:hypothetical protein
VAIPKSSIRITASTGPNLSYKMIMIPKLYFTGLLAAGYFTFIPLNLAIGSPGGHMPRVGCHGNGQRNEHCRYPNPFWGSSSPYHAGIYDSYYSYTPTPEQQATAKREVEPTCSQ